MIKNLCTRIVWQEGYYRIFWSGKAKVVRVWLRRRPWWRGGKMWMVSYFHGFLGHEVEVPLEKTGYQKLPVGDVVWLGDKNPADGGMLFAYGIPY
jgi:hypothetical protein